MPNAPRIPQYCLHKASGQAVVRLNGRDVYLGPHDTPKSTLEYERVIGEYLAAGRRYAHAADRMTINELILAYWRHAQTEYQDPTLPSLRSALRRLRRTYGERAVDEFGPLAFQTFRAAMIEEDLSRATVNKSASWIRSMFAWGVSQELVEPSVIHGLRAVKGLRRGRGGVRETDPVRPVDDEVVQRTLGFLPETVADMVRIQRLTGMRPGELCAMTTRSIDATGEVWIYAPDRHKTWHHGHSRGIAIGPRAREVLGRYLRTELDQPLFSPAESEQRRAEQNGAMPSEASKVSKARSKRSGKRRRRPPGESYSPASNRRAITRACDRAAVPRWTPNQLRHTKATELRRQFGLDGAGAILGHSKLETTQIYAERTDALAKQIAMQTG